MKTVLTQLIGALLCAIAASSFSGCETLNLGWAAKPTPTEAQQIREIVERPRSEFLAIRHNFLAEVLKDRWYAYEQTVVILLKAVSTARRISRFSVGDISDLPDGKESFAAAIQQVERSERVIKSLWRERHQGPGGTFVANSTLVRRSGISTPDRVHGMSPPMPTHVRMDTS